MPNVQEISSTGNSLGVKPQDNEFEVSVFGPGYGESVLVHLGNQEWMVVDSCVNPGSTQPAPLEYLRKIGINPSEAIKLIVATHWHDDHIRGLGSIVRDCTAASFVCSSALRPEEFLTLVEAYGRRSMMETSGVQEFYNILEIMKNRTLQPQWAVTGRLLWRRPSSNPDFLLPCEIHALSPSDASVTLAYHEIASLLPDEQTPKRRILAQTPNHTAVVLWVKVGTVSVLLGSDLEETKNPGTGWTVIVESPTRPTGKADLFKVPHHGSATADHQRIWEELLDIQPVAVLTPFVRGNVTLPTQKDTVRILQRTDHAYSTASTKLSKVKGRPPVVEKTIRETVKNIRRVHGTCGHVRIRTYALSSYDRPWTVERFGDALHLKNMYTPSNN